MPKKRHGLDPQEVIDLQLRYVSALIDQFEKLIEEHVELNPEPLMDRIERVLGIQEEPLSAYTFERVWEWLDAAIESERILAQDDPDLSPPQVEEKLDVLEPLLKAAAESQGAPPVVGEHVHRWVVETPEEARARVGGALDVLKGGCSCGETKEYPVTPLTKYGRKHPVEVSK